MLVTQTLQMPINKGSNKFSKTSWLLCLISLFDWKYMPNSRMFHVHDDDQHYGKTHNHLLVAGDLTMHSPYLLKVITYKSLHLRLKNGTKQN